MAIKLDEARIRSLTANLLNGGVALNSLNYGSYTLPLAGGKMTGTIHLGSTGLRTHDDTHGYYTDQYGNFFHCSNTSTDNWNVHNAAGNISLKYYWETGVLELANTLKFTNALTKVNSPTVVATFIGNNSANGIGYSNTSEMLVGYATNDSWGYNIYNSYNKRYESSVDLTSYDANTWYPVTINIPYGGLHRVACTCHLNTGSVPSWSTHTQGFTAVVEMLTTASGWGTTGGYSICLTNDQRFIADTNNPPVGYTQFTNGSRACFYCRGGGKYIFQSDFIGTWTLYATSTEVSSQTIAPSTTYPGLSFSKSAIAANLNGTASTLGRNGDIYAPMTFYWSGQSGQPSWLWGGNDGGNMYVYNPSNFNVNYANSAGSVAWNNVSGKPSTFTPSSHSHNYITSSGTMTMISGTAKWANGFTVGNIYSSGYPFSYGTTWMYQGTFGAELIFNGLGGDAGVGTGHMYFRTRSDWNTSTWGDWKHLLDSSNYTTYTVTKAGSGASGTWGINVTGSAATLSNSNAGTLTWSGDHMLSSSTRPNAKLHFGTETLYQHRGAAYHILLDEGNYTTWLVPKSGGTFTGKVAISYAHTGGGMFQLMSTSSNEASIDYAAGGTSYWVVGKGCGGTGNGTFAWYYVPSGKNVMTLTSAGALAITTLTTTTINMGGNLNLSNIGTCYIGNGAADTAPTVGGGLSNLVISSWWGISFTTSCTATYQNKTAIGFDCRNGIIRAAAVYGAVWNDYAEYRTTTAKVNPGRVVVENNDDTLSMSTERLMPGANIVSDTFGFAIGETDDAQTPLAVSGRVLAYPLEPREEYCAGDPVCSGPNGTVSKMTREEVMMYPDRIVGTVSSVPNYDTWGTGNVKVNGRIWIKVR